MSTQYISVEAIISAGKSTLLNTLSDIGETVLYEDIEQWKSFGENETNLLELMYTNDDKKTYELFSN